MKAAAIAPVLAGIANALPQACQTTTTQVIVPTSTATYFSTHVTTINAKTAKDLGTFTDIVRKSSTKTLQTITAIETECTANGTITVQPTNTVYTTAGNSSSQEQNLSGFPGPSNRDKTIHARQEADCTVTKTSTTTYGQTYTFLPAKEDITFTRFTDFSQATVTSTSTGGTAYAIATAATTMPALCGPRVNATLADIASNSTSTTTQDARCAPSALISAAGASETSPKYGLVFTERTSTGATYKTNTTDASSCCQLCVEANECAASAWDIRSGECRLEFPVKFGTGELSCGLGLQAYYGAGPNHPAKPGSGWFVAEVCGSAAFANAMPDDGT